MRNDFGGNEPLIQEISVSEAYYWVSEANMLNVGLRKNMSSPLGKVFSGQWQMSLVFSDLPAGREKLYPIQTREVRMLATVGAEHQRGRSYHGVAVIEAPENGVCRGRFHVAMLPERFNVLAGWVQSRGSLIIVGRFDAVLDAKGTAEILAATEADGYDRKERPRVSRTLRPQTQSAPAASP